MTSQCEIKIKDCMQIIKSMCIKREKKQHRKRQMNKHTSVYIYIYIYIKRYKCMSNGHKTNIHEVEVKERKENT